MDSALEFELEALTATYADDLTISIPADASDATKITLSLRPRGVEEHDAFVKASLRLHITSDYPNSCPKIELLDIKGIGDQRLDRLRETLQAEALLLAGEMSLGALCEHALEWITEENHPEGACAFCLLALLPGSHLGDQEAGREAGQEAGREPAGDEQQLVRLPCYHAFHRGCYEGWWCWRQPALEAQEQQLVRHTGASAASVLREQDLPPRDEDGAYETSCPVCRTPAPAACLDPDLRQQLTAARCSRSAGKTAATGSRQSRGRQPHLSAGHTGGGEPAAANDVGQQRLSAEELAAYREVQKRHAAVLARQRAAGGLIEQASYSIAGWTQGQDNSTQPQPQPPSAQAQQQPKSQSRSQQDPQQAPRQQRRPGAHGERAAGQGADLLEEGGSAASGAAKGGERDAGEGDCSTRQGDREGGGRGRHRRSAWRHGDGVGAGHAGRAGPGSRATREGGVVSQGLVSPMNCGGTAITSGLAVDGEGSAAAAACSALAGLGLGTRQERPSSSGGRGLLGELGGGRGSGGYRHRDVNGPIQGACECDTVQESRSCSAMSSGRGGGDTRATKSTAENRRAQSQRVGQQCGTSDRAVGAGQGRGTGRGNGRGSGGRKYGPGGRSSESGRGGKGVLEEGSRIEKSG